MSYVCGCGRIFESLEARQKHRDGLRAAFVQQDDADAAFPCDRALGRGGRSRLAVERYCETCRLTCVEDLATSNAHQRAHLQGDQWCTACSSGFSGTRKRHEDTNAHTAKRNAWIAHVRSESNQPTASLDLEPTPTSAATTATATTSRSTTTTTMTTWSALDQGRIAMSNALLEPSRAEPAIDIDIGNGGFSPADSPDSEMNDESDADADLDLAAAEHGNVDPAPPSRSPDVEGEEATAADDEALGDNDELFAEPESADNNDDAGDADVDVDDFDEEECDEFEDDEVARDAAAAEADIDGAGARKLKALDDAAFKLVDRVVPLLDELPLGIDVPVIDCNALFETGFDANTLRELEADLIQVLDEQPLAERVKDNIFRVLVKAGVNVNATYASAARSVRCQRGVATPPTLRAEVQRAEPTARQKKHEPQQSAADRSVTLALPYRPLQYLIAAKLFNDLRALQRQGDARAGWRDVARQPSPYELAVGERAFAPFRQRQSSVLAYSSASCAPPRSIYESAAFYATHRRFRRYTDAGFLVLMLTLSSDGVRAVGQEESLVVRVALWLNGERHWFDVYSYRDSMVDGDDALRQCVVAQLRQLRNGVLFDFPSQFNLPPLRLVVGVLDFCVDKLELADFLCLAGAAPSIVWPFPVGGPSGAWRRAPMCASSASLNDTSVAWRSTERAKTVARLVAQQLGANGTIADAKAQLRAVGLNPRRFFRRGTYVLPPFCDDVFEDLVSAGAVRFYSCLLHQHWLGLVGHHGIMRCVRSLDWNQLGMINQLLVDMPRASGFVHFTKAQFVQVASIRDALASMRAAAPATLAAKKYYSITARVGSGRQKRALAVLLVPILQHCNLTDWARMLSAMLLYTHALDTDNIVAAEKMWRAATRCMVGADAPEFAYPPSIAKLDGGRDAKNARLWAVPKARDEALAVVSVPFFGPARLATTAGNEQEHKLFKRLMQRHSQFHPISGGAAALSGRTRAESATALAVHAGARDASVTDADVDRGRFDRMQVAAFVEENSRVEKHVAPELIATLRRHMLLGDADETDTVIKPNSLSVRSGRLRIWQRSSSSSSNDETRDAATSDRERRTTLLAPSTPSVPTFVRFVTISDTDDELLTSFDAARHSGRSRIGKLVGVHQVRFKLNARGQRFQSRLFVELQLYRASEQDPIWCYAKLTRSMAHVFVAVDELALLERIYVTEHLAMQCLWHWLM